MTTISVVCARGDREWTCDVTVGADAASTRHAVTVEDETLRALDRSAADPARLVEASFRFLLEREPRESILRSFALPVIGTYFPDWEAEVRATIRG